MFSSAGLLEGIDEEQQQKQRQRTTFDEDMQTAVYMAAHDSQRQGKRGLGKSTTLKIAGEMTAVFATYVVLVCALCRCVHMHYTTM